MKSDTKTHFIIKSSLVFFDLAFISLCFTLYTWLTAITGGSLFINDYIGLWPFLFIFWIVFEKAGLYQGCAMYSGSSLGPVEELRRIFYVISAIFLALGFANYVYRPNEYLYSRKVFFATYLTVLLFLPINRMLLRKCFCAFNRWGVATIIIGSGKIARTIYNKLQQCSEYGLRPIGYFTDPYEPENKMPLSLRYLGNTHHIKAFCQDFHIKYAIIAIEGLSTAYLENLMKQYGKCFSHILYVPQTTLASCAWVTPKDISGMLGLEIRHNLQIPYRYRAKRFVDFLLTWPLIILALPFMLLIALWVKMDSPGPVFFKHKRLGKNGRKINIYKFRTMVQNADTCLNELLTNTVWKSEWESYGKLKTDPRLTDVGKWLRKTSLDELPQLFNVLQGKLTLVGPRPIIEDEREKYGADFDLFDMVLPGITGLWQVSGRNELTYADRVQLDKYYVNNWSIWLDIYILGKTFYSVLFQHGAN